MSEDSRSRLEPSSGTTPSGPDAVERPTPVSVKDPITRIGMIGIGNVGGHLAQRFQRTGVHVVQAVSRHPERIADLVGPETILVREPAQLDPDLDAYLLAVPDDAIAGVAASLNVSGLVLHCSGSVPMDVLAKAGDRIGVFYPLQSFRHGHVIASEGSSFPVCVCAAYEQDTVRLEDLARRMGQPARRLDDTGRQALHLAAVFANNFANHCFATAQRLCEVRGLEFELLQPLIMETAARLCGSSAEDMQTGPARRGDVRTIDRHLQQLSNDPDMAELYRTLTTSIQRMYGS